MGIVFAGLSALLFGAADFAGGVATRRSPVYAVLVVSQTMVRAGVYQRLVSPIRRATRFTMMSRMKLITDMNRPIAEA